MSLRSLFLMVTLLAACGFASAQTPDTCPTAAPTTRVLAIGRLTSVTARDKIAPGMQQTRFADLSGVVAK
jgi:hypothetical protein